jgi:lipopolysaccharide assembly outer membrane protein LptD (OstA)
MNVVSNKRCRKAVALQKCVVFSAVLCLVAAHSFGAGAVKKAEKTSVTNNVGAIGWDALTKGALGKQQQAANASNKVAQMEITADALDSNQRTGWATAKGHVVIRRGDEELQADYVSVNLNTQDAEAVGHVVMKKAGGIWKGDRLKGNFKTGVWDAVELMGNMTPFQVKAAKTDKAGNNVYMLHEANVTTCTNKWDDCHYHVVARELEVVPGQYMKAHGSTFYLGSVPFFYLPYWYRDFNGDYGFSFYAGAGSDMGTWLLTSYHYPITDIFKGETHLDVRSARGLAVGQDVRWHAFECNCIGEVSAYGLNDRAPNTADENAIINSGRYRIGVKNTCDITDVDSILLKAIYLSDVYVMPDFFEDEYSESIQPDNYLTYMHRGQDYSASLRFSGRLNDFYSGVNRLPEAAIDFSSQEIGDTLLYYEGRTAVGFLQETEAGSNNVDYSVFRLDSSHLISCPTKEFGFLNIIPRAGYRGTYYSATLQTASQPYLTTNYVVDSSGVTNAVLGTNNLTSIVDEPGKLRSLVEIGMEVSFKAFRTWDSDGTPMRHVVEPYADYTFVPEPTVASSNLYQFDEVDGLDEVHKIKLGVRNKLQTKHGNSAADLIDLDTYTILKIKRAEGGPFINYLYFDAIITPDEYFTVRSDGVYDVPNSVVDTFNVELQYADKNLMSLDTDYRFQRDDSELISEDALFYLSRKWYLGVYGRYEFDDSRLQEIGGYVQRNYDCISVRTGVGNRPGYTDSNGARVKDNWRLNLEFWLRAFPGSGYSAKHRA